MFRLRKGDSMAKPFDATLNALISARPEDWARYFAHLAGIPPGPFESLDTDLATTVQADKVFRINGEKPAILHLELEANPRLGVPRDLMRYNTLIDHQHDLPVESVLVLLRPKALASDMTGTYQRLGVGGDAISQFRYRVERVWEHPVEDWLRGGIGVAPLALLTDEASGNLEQALERFRACLSDAKADEGVTKSILGSSYVLCGLRYDHARVAEMYRRLAMLMEESTTYQEILGKGLTQGLERGQLQAHRNVLLRQGTKRFGPPTPEVAAALAGIADLTRLERLAERILDATGWDDLLATQ
jgi:hypothetical protein